VATSILIVDDSKLARIVVGKAVAAVCPDWERLEASSAAEALELLASRDIHVVVVDYNMPGQICRLPSPPPMSRTKSSRARGRRMRPSSPSRSPKRRYGHS
jgi:CheY-like chemotaxis protein